MTLRFGSTSHVRRHAMHVVVCALALIVVACTPSATAPAEIADTTHTQAAADPHRNERTPSNLTSAAASATPADLTIPSAESPSQPATTSPGAAVVSVEPTVRTNVAATDSTATSDAHTDDSGPPAGGASDSGDAEAISIPMSIAQAAADAGVALGTPIADELHAVAVLADTFTGGPAVGVVDHGTQTLWIFDGHTLAQYLVSTGTGGISNQPGSAGTPAGRHRVGHIVRGATGEIVRGWGPTGRYPHASGKAYMTTRAYSLIGLEARNANSVRRGIFVHGTNIPERLGAPASGGCIRVADAVAELLDGVIREGSIISILAD